MAFQKLETSSNPEIDSRIIQPKLPVTIDIEPEMVMPAEPTPDHTLFLCNIDQESAYRVETIFFFPCTATVSAGKSLAAGDDVDNNIVVVNILKEALRKVLVPYYFMAGRLKLVNDHEEAESCTRLEVECNQAAHDHGVLFAGAKADLTFSELGDITVPDLKFRNLILETNNTHSLAQTPLLTVQVTRFKCGSFTFGMSMLHSMMDGVSVTCFLKNYASFCRGEGLLIQPNPDRTMLRARSSPEPGFYEELIMQTFPPAPDKSYSSCHDQLDMAITQSEKLPIECHNNFPPSNHTYKTFAFSIAMINALKERVLAQNRLSVCSTFEVLAAHIWQTRTKALEMNPDDLSPLFFAVDIRNKMNPPLPERFTGNAIAATFTSMKVKELCESHLSICVERIQKAIKIITDQYVRSWTDWWELNRKSQVQLGGFCVSSWWKMPFYDVDFGWGRPKYAGPVPNQLVYFVLLLSNGKGDGGLNIYLGLEPHQMERFEQEIYSGL